MGGLNKKVYKSFSYIDSISIDFWHSSKHKNIKKLLFWDKNYKESKIYEGFIRDIEEAVYYKYPKLRPFMEGIVDRNGATWEEQNFIVLQCYNTLVNTCRYFNKKNKLYKSLKLDILSWRVQ